MPLGFSYLHGLDVVRNLLSNSTFALLNCDPHPCDFKCY